MSEAPTEPFSHHLVQARDADAAARAFRDREALRHAGVAWSGLSADPFPAASERDLRAIAQARLTAAQIWRQRPEGDFLNAIGAVQRAAERLHAGAEQARASAARGLEAERAHCALLVAEFRRQARDLTAGLRACDRALRRLD